MSVAEKPKVLTANALLEGDVVYLAPDGGWTRQHDKALLITDAATAELVDKRNVMACNQYSYADLVKATKDSHDLDGKIRVEVAGRFVGDQ